MPLSVESRQEILREAEGSAVGSYTFAGGRGGGIWHRRGALEFRRFDEVRRDLGLELRRGDVLAAAAPRGEHVDDRVGGGDGGEEGRAPGRARPVPFAASPRLVGP